MTAEMDCPDCGAGWDLAGGQTVCVNCGLTVDDIDAADAFLLQLDAERHAEREEVEL